MVRDFVYEELVVDRNAWDLGGRLYLEFLEWNSDRQPSWGGGRRLFYMELRELGMRVEPGNRNKMYVYGCASKREAVG